MSEKTGLELLACIRRDADNLAGMTAGLTENVAAAEGIKELIAGIGYDANELERQIKTLAAAVRVAQWGLWDDSPAQNGWLCPWCKETKDSGHYDKCPIGLALAPFAALEVGP